MERGAVAAVLISVKRNVSTLVFLLSCLAAPPIAGAQDGGVGLPDWVEADPFSGGRDDPIGIDRADRLETVSPTRPGEALQPNVPVQHGEVLSAIAGVREREHTMEVRLEHGLARVDVSMTFASRARYPAELRYRLPVPRGASLARLEVCNAAGCTDGRVDETPGPLGPYDDAVRAHEGGRSRPPVAHAALIRGAGGGEALWLRAAPVRPEPRRGQPGSTTSGELTLRVRYLVPAPVRGGHARLTIPARGRDARAAAARIRVRSDELRGGAVDGLDAVESSVERAPWQPAEVSAALAHGPPIVTEAWEVPCGEGRCGRLRAVATPRPVEARDIILLLDASPSTAGAARGRIGPTVAALLSALPSRSRLRVVAFAARAEPIIDEPTSPTDVSLVRVARALERELGSATRFEAAWEAVRGWVRPQDEPLLLLIGDGGLTTSEVARRAFEQARRAGAQIAALNVADRPTTAGLAQALEAVDGRAIHAGPEADRAGRGHGMDPLTERMNPLLAPVVEERVRVRIGRRTLDLGPLRAGEERVWEGRLRGRAAILAGRTGHARPAPEALALGLTDRLERATGQRSVPLRLAALRGPAPAPSACTTQGVFHSPSAVVGPREPLLLADTRRCDEPIVPRPRPAAESAPRTPRPERLRRHEGPTSLPERSLLTLLRQRIVPAARGCFRDDRRGRPSYQRRAVFEFRLADREVIEARVRGELGASLRDCLGRAIDELEIPPFDGVVSVRYPVYVAPRLPPPTLSLDPDVADVVDDVASDSDPDPDG